MISLNVNQFRERIHFIEWMNEQLFERNPIEWSSTVAVDKYIFYIIMRFAKYYANYYFNHTFVMKGIVYI